MTDPGSDRTQEAADGSPLLRFEAVTKRFGAFTAVDALSLDIRRGEFFALLGPSGCGKSTLLRLAAGFEIPDGGRILLDGEDVGRRPPHLRPVNMMFQSYALFPHMTVEGNVAFGLKQERRPREEIARRVAAMLSLVRLESLGHRKPHELSGGQRQRVALARALVKEPKVLLLDEPLAALDKKLREETGAELLALQRRLGTTFVIVTHDQEEAMTLADRIAVMRSGRVAQSGTPAAVYERPRDREVAGFIGDVNLLEGRVAGAAPEGTAVRTAVGLLHTGDAVPREVGARVWVALRPEKLQVTRALSGHGTGGIAAVVAAVVFRGESLLLRLRVGEEVTLKAAVPNGGAAAAAPWRVGDAVRLTWGPDSCVLLEA